jgi:trehalose 6-phosphate phosphatase
MLFSPPARPAISPNPAATAISAQRPSALPVLDTRTALFLDFDGTLAEIAPQPDLVEVSPDLVDLLRSLAARLDGALAVVTGRALADIDHFLQPLVLSVAAEHGAVQRLLPGQVQHVARPDLHDVHRVALALAAEHPALRVEMKSAAIAVHFRQAPELEQLCLEQLAEAVKRTLGVELIQGKLVFEIKPAGVSKGTAIASLMTLAPFTGRVPVFAGDDTTDETGFAVVQAAGGHGIKVGPGASAATYRCASPPLMRQWLHDAAKG